MTEDSSARTGRPNLDTISRRVRPVAVRIKEWLREESFRANWVGALTNPSFIIRSCLARKIETISDKVSGRILDFGCGSKPYASLFVRAESYIGLDTQNSQHNHQHSKIDVEFDGETIPFEDNYFDAVVSFEVFQHIFSIDKVLAEISRVLRPGGKLLISVPFMWEETEPPGDFARYTFYGLKSILEQHRFTVLEQERCNSSYLASRQIVLAYRMQVVRNTPNPILRALTQIIWVSGGTLWSLLFASIMPSNDALYSSQIVLAQKP